MITYSTVTLVSCKFRLAQKLSRKFKRSLSQNPGPILSENLYEYYLVFSSSYTL